jgi:plastocyanin
MLTRRKFLYVLGVAGAGGLLAGCGIRDSEPDFTVTIGSGSMFTPASLVIPVGSVVGWHNRSEHVHTVTADPEQSQMPERISLPSGASPFDSGNLYSGERWVYTFDVPGMYVYFCRYHEVHEMLGSIVVTA